MSETTTPEIDSPTTTYATPANRAIFGLIVVVVGVAGMFWSFVNGIGAALSGGDSGALPWEILFAVAAVLVLAALALAIVHVVHGQTVLLSVITIVIAAIPILAILGGVIVALPIFQ